MINMTVAESQILSGRDTYRFGNGAEPCPQPGTSGWTARDLDDPEVERDWVRNRYELVEGVLTKMPPAYFVGGNCAFNLMTILKSYSSERGLNFRLAAEGEIVIDQRRVLRADGLLLTPADARRQDQAARSAGKIDPKRVRLLVPPTLVIESVSPGHETHDRETKRAWYAEFGIPHYWIVDAFAGKLECLCLNGVNYDLDAAGTHNDIVEPRAFPGLKIPLRELWET
jgi:Uma2 family endonuclease